VTNLKVVFLTELDELLETGKFQEATELFKQELAKRKLLNPAVDKEWHIYADKISAYLTAKQGLKDTADFWAELYDFFVDDIEKPLKIQMHKGHVLFRWGLALLIIDFDKGKQKLKEALEEDRKLAQVTTSSPQEAEERLKLYSAYAWLCIIESLTYGTFVTDEEKRKFFESILGPAYDYALAGMTTDPSVIKKRLQIIIGQPAIAAHAIKLYEELLNALQTGSPITIVTLNGSVLECILLSLLFGKGVKKLKNNKDIKDAELGGLLSEVNDRSEIKNNTVRAIAELVRAFRNRIHPANELQKQDYLITSAVASTLKNLLDYAILNWN